MKQYCRYCAYACQIENDMCWCNKRGFTMKKTEASRLNKCKDFGFNEIDVFNIEHRYKPREKRNNDNQNDKQLSIFDYEELE